MAYKMIPLQLFLLIGFTACVRGNLDPCYRAGVVEHLRLGRDLPINHSDIYQYVRENLKVYDQIASDASQNGVQILVFGEESIFQAEESTNPSLTVRQATRQLCENLPNVNNGEQFNPCDEVRLDMPINNHLSCLAKSSNLYLVAQLCDVQFCSNDADPNCPIDSQYMYNTQVVYGPDGRLVAKYHKHHLFGELQYDVPDQEYVVFDTPIGRMGLFVCFDKIWKAPGVELAENGSVDTVRIMHSQYANY